MATCQICCEKLNKSTHKSTICNHCNYETCNDCMKKFILSKQEYAYCMNPECKKKWDREVLLTKFTKKFVNEDYKTHRENVLFNIEKALLPATQEYAETLKREREYEKKIPKINEDYKNFEKIVNNKIKDLSYNLAITSDREKNEELRFKINKLRMKLTCEAFNVKQKIAHIRYCMAIIRNNMNNNNLINDKKEITGTQYMRICPVETCNGFINKKWICGICNVKLCSECHEIKNEQTEEHECNEDNVKTAKLLMKDTKPCPNCAVLIFKIEGCDQMWCTSCMTPFSWNTGEIVKGTIHNPHYYEFLNRNGNAGPRFRNLGDEICGGLINYFSIKTEKIDRYYPNINDENIPNEIKYFSNIHRMYYHIQDIVMRKYIVNNVRDNRNLRAAYLLNELKEADFKAKLQQNEKANDKNNDIRMLLEMYQHTTVDIVRKMYESKTKDEFDKNAAELAFLMNYFNNESEKIKKRYNNVAPYIYKNWSYIY